MSIAASQQRKRVRDAALKANIYFIYAWYGLLFEAVLLRPA